MKLKNEKIVYTAKNRTDNYYTLLEREGVVYLYSNCWTKEILTVCSKSRDGLSFEKPEGVFKNSGVTHNFLPFKNKNGELYGIGGVDSWKHEAKWHTIDDYELFKKEFLKRFNTPYIKDEARFQRFREVIKSKKCLNHTSGLYLFKHETNNIWSQVQKQPIVTAWSDGFNSAFKWGKSTEFDGHISIVYNNKTDKYILYLRNNIKCGTRYIQYAESKDLINWSKFKSINIDGFDVDKDNYYYANIIKHPDRDLFIGFLPYFDNLNCCVRLVASEDGINFKITGELFNDKIALLKDKPKNTIMAVNGILHDNDNYYIYFHFNYLGLDQNKDVVIKRFEVDKNSFNGAFKC